MFISKQTLSDVICAGIEGGIQYWADIMNVTAPEKVTFPEATKLLTACMNKGGVVHIADVEDESEQWELTYEKLKAGLEVMKTKYPWHYKNITSDNADAETGDVLIQCALFGEIVFG